MPITTSQQKFLFPLSLLLILAMAGPMAKPVRAGQNEALGTLLGAGVGGFAGNQFGHGSGRVAATTGGVIFGGLAGNAVGHGMDQAERPSLSYAQPYYPSQPVYYSYVPNYVAPEAPPAELINETPGDYCREYSELVHVGNEFRESYGTACLQPDGSWKAVQ